MKTLDVLEDGKAFEDMLKKKRKECKKIRLKISKDQESSDREDFRRARKWKNLKNMLKIEEK